MTRKNNRPIVLRVDYSGCFRAFPDLHNRWLNWRPKPRPKRSDLRKLPACYQP